MSDLPAKVWAHGTRPAFVQSSAATTNPTPSDAANPEDTGHASYVIVPETNLPHDTLKSAQVLPDVPYFGVIGTLGSEVDLFRMPIDPGMVGLRFELVSQQDPPRVPLQFSLFDGSGQMVGHWSSGGDPGALSLGVELAGPPSGTTLFLRISATSPNDPEGSSSTINYQLWITRLDATDLQPANTGGVGTPLATSVLPIFLAAPLPVSAASLPLEPAPPRADAQAVLAAPILTSPGDGLRVAVGSLALRSAGPSGGVMADGDPTTSSPHQRAAMMDLEGMDRSLPTPNLDPGEGMSPKADFGRGGVPKTLVALRGPGGFPLLGAAAIGNWRRAPAAIAAASAEPPAPDGAAPPAADRLAGQAPPSDAAASPAEADHPSEAIATRTQCRGEYRVSPSSGLSLATALTLNMMLSDPVAGFDYLASYFDERARELRRQRTDSRGKLSHRGQPD